MFVKAGALIAILSIAFLAGCASVPSQPVTTAPAGSPTASALPTATSTPAPAPVTPRAVPPTAEIPLEAYVQDGVLHVQYGSEPPVTVRPDQLPPLGRGEIRHPVALPGRRAVVFNTYLCNPAVHLYNAPDCTVGIYDVDAETGKVSERFAGLNGNSMQDHDFEISPDGRWISVAASGHVDVYSIGYAGNGLVYLDALTYLRTRPDEYLPWQYWLPDSSGLILIAATYPYNEPGTIPAAFAAYRYELGGTAVQIPLGAAILRGDIWQSGCVAAISPDRNWIYFYGNGTGDTRLDIFGYLGNLNDGSLRNYDLGEWYCGSVRWSPDSRHFAYSGTTAPIGSVDGPPTPIEGFFSEWLDATHYTYWVETTVNGIQTFEGEIDE